MRTWKVPGLWEVYVKSSVVEGLGENVIYA
jgi:hypothetical protein